MILSLGYTALVVNVVLHSLVLLLSNYDGVVKNLDVVLLLLLLLLLLRLLDMYKRQGLKPNRSKPFHLHVPAFVGGECPASECFVSMGFRS